MKFSDHIKSCYLKINFKHIDHHFRRHRQHCLLVLFQIWMRSFCLESFVGSIRFVIYVNKICCRCMVSSMWEVWKGCLIITYFIWVLSVKNFCEDSIFFHFFLVVMNGYKFLTVMMEVKGIIGGNWIYK